MSIPQSTTRRVLDRAALEVGMLHGHLPPDALRLLVPHLPRSWCIIRAFFRGRQVADPQSFRGEARRYAGRYIRTMAEVADWAEYVSGLPTGSCRVAGPRGGFRGFQLPDMP